MKSPKSATLLFRSGKLVSTGTKTLEQINQSIVALVENLRKAGIQITEVPKIEVQNIVASADLGQMINLNAIAVSLGLDKVEYEPEQFPGLVYRLSDPKVCILLFGSGKLVCTGARTPKDVERAVHKVAEDLRDVDQLK